MIMLIADDLELILSSIRMLVGMLVKNVGENKII